MLNFIQKRLSVLENLDTPEAKGEQEGLLYVKNLLDFFSAGKVPIDWTGRLMQAGQPVTFLSTDGITVKLSSGVDVCALTGQHTNPKFNVVSLDLREPLIRWIVDTLELDESFCHQLLSGNALLIRDYITNIEEFSDVLSTLPCAEDQELVIIKHPNQLNARLKKVGAEVSLRFFFNDKAIYGVSIFKKIEEL